MLVMTDTRPSHSNRPPRLQIFSSGHDNYKLSARCCRWQNNRRCLGSGKFQQDGHWARYDWNSNTFPLLTAPLFLLSLPSQLTQSIPSASCHNNITCAPLQPYVTQPTLSTSDLPSSSFTSTSIQGIIPEVMAANTPISERTSTCPQFQAPYVTSMAYAGAPGSPFFEGANISKFWKRFENMCDDY